MIKNSLISHTTVTFQPLGPGLSLNNPLLRAIVCPTEQSATLNPLNFMFNALFFFFNLNVVLICNFNCNS